jgi:hypothetical protein
VRPCPPVACLHGHLAHFPIRSPGQYLAKIAVTSLQYLVMPDRGADLGSCRTGDDRRPHPVPGRPLTCTPRIDGEAHAWRAVLHCAEELARRQGGWAASLSADGRLCADRQAEVLAGLHAQLARQDRLRQRLHVRLVRQNGLLADQHEELARSHDRLRANEHRLADQDRLLADQDRRIADQDRLLRTWLQELTDSRHLLREQELRLQEGEQRLRMLRDCLAGEGERVARELRQSWTWRVGRLLVAPFSRLKALRPGALR